VGDNQEKPSQVYAAAAANLVIAASKLTAAAVTGSSAMLSEGIHSVADTGNQVLTLLGLRRSKRPPDPLHPFGHGQEVYFWGFVVAMVLFSLGGGMSVYEGIHRMQHREGVSDPFWNYVVLAIAAVAESFSLYFALQKFRQSMRPDEHWWAAVRRSKDPSVFIILAEDAAALAGIAVAFVGILLQQILNSVIPDAIASIIIGGILGVVAALLAIETHALLLGESADPEIVSEIVHIVRTNPYVIKAHTPLTMHFGPNDILVNMTVEFRPDTPSEILLDSIADFEISIRRTFPQVQRVFIETESLKKTVHHEPAA